MFLFDVVIVGAVKRKLSMAAASKIRPEAMSLVYRNGYAYLAL